MEKVFGLMKHLAVHCAMLLRFSGLLILHAMTTFDLAKAMNYQWLD